MKEKALVVTTVASTIDQFCMNDIDILLKIYKEVHVMANFREGNNTSNERINEFKNELINRNIVIHDIDLSRSPFSKKNIIQYRIIKKLIDNQKYDLIHCHTPIASILTRIAARKSRKNGTKVMYTAHGFHFFKGAPIINWILYYIPEKICSYFTDILITINQEDYILAQNKMMAKKVEYIAGVGVDVNKFKYLDIDKLEKRKEIGIPEDAVMLFSVGELNKNKNHEVIIRSLAKLNNSNIHYCIAGKGILEEYLIELSKELNVYNNVHLLGFRTDIGELYKCADIYCFPSYREGLSVALMEAMSSGLPVICSDIRGNIDLLENKLGGYRCNPSSINEFSLSINTLVKNKKIREKMGEYNKNQISKFDFKIINNDKYRLYINID